MSDCFRWKFLKREGHSKKFSFFVFAYSKHSAIPLTKISAPEVPATLKKYVSNEATSEAAVLNCTWQPGRVYVTSFRPTQNWRQGEKPATDFVSFTRSAKCFLQSDYSLHRSHLNKISWTEWHHENATWLLRTVQNGGNDVRILGFFGDKFHKENLQFRGWNFREWLNLVQGFY